MKIKIFRVMVILMLMLMSVYFPVKAEQVPFYVTKIDHSGWYYPEQNWLPITVYFSHKIKDPGKLEDYLVIFDEDGNFSTWEDQQRVPVSNVSISNHSGWLPDEKGSLQLDINDFAPKDKGRFLVKVGDAITDEDGNHLDSHHSAGATYQVRVYNSEKPKVVKVYAQPSEEWPNRISITVDFNVPVMDVNSYSIKYDEDGDLNTKADQKDAIVRAGGTFYGPMESDMVTHARYSVKIDDLKPGADLL